MVPPMNARADEAPPEAAAEISDVVADNVKRHRAERGLSLSELSSRSGVSRAMIHQIERRQSAPTINVVWKLATALGLPFSALLEQPAVSAAKVVRGDRAWTLSSDDGRFNSRALFPMEGERRAELYELVLEPGADEAAAAHAPGTHENIAVAEGKLTVEVGEETHQLANGDAIFFCADSPHRYRNLGKVRVRAFLVMTYA